MAPGDGKGRGEDTFIRQKRAYPLPVYSHCLIKIAEELEEWQWEWRRDETGLGLGLEERRHDMGKGKK